MKKLITRAFPVYLILAFTASPPLSRADNVPDKTQFHLFHPTPDQLMRDLSPDRPDATESPVTVDAGHFVIETSFFDWRRNDGDDAYTVMANNLKLGLTNNTDLQLVFDTFSWEKPRSGDRTEGFADIQLRLKHNLWGNDEGDTALALFPYIKIPTDTQRSNGQWEGGLIIPFSMEINERLGLGLMAEFDALYSETTLTHEFQFLHSAVLGFAVTEQIGSFIEYIGITGNATYQSSLSGGFTVAIDEDLVFDVGTQIGLNDASGDLGVFAGFTKRY